MYTYSNLQKDKIEKQVIRRYAKDFNVKKKSLKFLDDKVGFSLIIPLVC